MDQVTAAAQQDALRPLRYFIAALDATYYADQSYAGADAYPFNPPGQFTVNGPYGTAVEGQPVSLTRAGGVTISPALVMLGLGVAAALLWKH